MAKPLYIQAIAIEAGPQKLGEKIQIGAGEVLSVDPKDFDSSAQMITVTYKQKKYLTDKGLLRSSMS